MAKYKLGTTEFQTWKEVITHTKTILDKGCRELTDEEFKFAKDLFHYHVHADSKLINNISSIKVGLPKYGTGLCFLITDNTGFEQDISYKKCRPICIKKPEKAKAQESKKRRLDAYRYAIASDIMTFKCSSNLVCSNCASEINPEVDHITPFVSLVNSFEQEFSFKNYPQLERCSKLSQTYRFSTNSCDDALFVKAWQEYHSANATLQVLCLKCNVSKNSQGIRYKPVL